MVKLTRKILGNVAGAVSDITFSDWNYGNYGIGTDQVILVAYNPLLKQSAVNTSSIRSGGIYSLSTPATWALQTIFVYIFTGNGDIASTSQFVGSVTV